MSGALALVLIWCNDAPGRIGEVLLPPPGSPGPSCVFGRGAPRRGAKSRIGLVRDRPGRTEPTEPLVSKAIAPDELAISSHGIEFIDVASLGGARMRHDDREVSQARLGPGSVLQVGSELLFLCVRRPAWSFALVEGARVGPFGLADDDGIVGESPAIWELRHRIAFVGPRTEHVLVCREAGTERELVARAVHRRSPRGRLEIVIGNVPAFAEPLVDLFGNGEGYPKPGMPERQGLVGRAEGSTLVLDDVDELPERARSRLARLLESGEYQRLGDSRVFRADVRVVGTTSRPSAVPYELGSRLELRIDVPGLNARREDIPLLARSLGEGGAAADGDDRSPLSLDLVRALVSRHYVGHVRELDGLLTRALRASDPGWLRPTPAPSVRPTRAPSNEIPPPPSKRVPKKQRARSR